MKKQIIIFLLLFFCQFSYSQEKPNIILIMVDDMGFSDIGCYGSEISTPNIDELASNGLRFSQFYNTARCCPTRASLMTGLYNHRAGMGLMTVDQEQPGYRGKLVRERCTTIPEILKDAGYGTYMSGKWHLGTDEGQRPLDWGFDRFYGILEGATNYFNPGRNNMGLITLDNDTLETDSNFYATNNFTDYAQIFLEEHLNTRSEDPFFLYLAYNAPHWPLQALPEDIEKYRGLYEKGYDVIREERYQRQLSSGLLKEENTELSTRSDGRYALEGTWPNSRKAIPAWTSLSEMQKEDFALRMAIYAAMIDNVDQNIGKLVQFLEQEEKLDNTMIIFLSDNGGALGGALTGYNHDGNWGNFEIYGTEESFISYGLGWANASNTPFRMYKCYVHEGGIASPLIIQWPGKISPANGSFERTPAHVIDIMPTILEAADTQYPDQIPGRSIVEYQGQSLIPLIVDQSENFNSDRMLFWEHAGSKAVRYKNWKLSQVHKEDWELYDFTTDRTEINNLIELYPDTAEMLLDAYQDWATENYVYPLAVSSLPETFENKNEVPVWMNANQNAPQPAIVANPSKSELNPSDSVLLWIKAKEAPVYAGAMTELNAYDIRFRGDSTYIHMKVMKEDNTDPLSLQLIRTDNGINEEGKYPQPAVRMPCPAPNEWIDYVIDFSASEAKSLNWSCIYIMGVLNSTEPGGWTIDPLPEDVKVYIDDIMISDSPEPLTTGRTRIFIDRKGKLSYVLNNPVRELLTLDGIENIRIIEIFDINGKPLKQYEIFNKDHFQIPVADLDNGVYFVRFFTDKGSFETSKIVKI